MSDLKLTPSTEDYMKTIYEISQESKVVRIKQIANRLNVKMPSVVNAVKQLESKGLINHESYGYIELTKTGREVGEKLYNRHKVLSEFLIDVLQVDEAIAFEDACAIEHYLHPETVEKVVKFLSFLKLSPDGEPNWLRKFKLYLKTGKKECEKLRE